MRIYIAGKYSDDNILGCLDNIREGLKASAKALKEGYSVFCPFLDYQFHFFEPELKVADYQRNSMDRFIIIRKNKMQRILLIVLTSICLVSLMNMLLAWLGVK